MLIPPVPSIPHLVRDIVPGQKRFTTRRAYFPHAAWLGQGSPHCPISPTAASRRSLARVSVPVWGTVLSDPLPIVGSVGRHPADYLMGRMPVTPRLPAFTPRGCPLGAARRITRRFHRLYATGRWVAYALRTRPPLSCPRRGIPVRLACIRPAASVHPEPGSNSSLYYCLSFLFFCLMGSALPSYLLRFLICRIHALAGPGCSFVLASSYQRSLSKTSPLSRSSLPCFAGAKVQLFYLPTTLFLFIFYHTSQSSDYQF